MVEYPPPPHADVGPALPRHRGLWLGRSATTGRHVAFLPGGIRRYHTTRTLPADFLPWTTLHMDFPHYPGCLVERHTSSLLRRQFQFLLAPAADPKRLNRRCRYTLLLATSSTPDVV